MENKEEKFLDIISKTLSKNGLIGDDCAYLKEFNLVVSQDTLVEGVHFRLDLMTPFDLGKKALLVNISDILASGAKPCYLTVSLSGKLNGEFVEKFYKGADEICKKFGVEIIGGDLTGGDKITVSVTILGDTKGRNISSRKNAKAGDVVLLCGVHGSSICGLKKLLGGNKNKTKKDKEFIRAHIEPKLYPEISEAIAKNCKDYAMTDTSDGLFDALKKVSAASSVGFKVSLKNVQKQTEDKGAILFGGEDYGLLICINKEDYKKIEDLNIPVIGEVTTNTEILIDGEKIKDDKRFNHF